LSYERARVTRRFPPSMLDGVLALARRKEALFGPAEAPFRHPLRAPARDLIGRAVADLPAGGPDVSPAAVLFDNTEALGSVTPAAGVVPARVSGRVRWTGTLARLSLAVAVNGVIRATTRTLPPDRDAWRSWSAMIPPDAFVAGANRVALYAVDEGGVGGRLLAEAGNATGDGPTAP
jgi:hypothetical protein